MASLKRPKRQRDDQPALFGSPVEPVMIVGDDKNALPVGEAASGLLVNKNKITTKAEVESEPARASEPSEDEASPADRRTSSRGFSRKPLSSWERHGRYVPVYVVKMAGQVLDLETPERIAELLASGQHCIHAYVAKSLHVVAAAGCVWDMPDSIFARFTGDEVPAPTRECFLLTADLYDTIVEKCGDAERAFERGEMTDVNYRIMCHRMRWEHGVEAHMRRYGGVCDLADSSANGVQ